jgi:preprotein translocase subunit SecE
MAKKIDPKGKKTANKPRKKGRVIQYFREVAAETKKVTWPSRKELAVNTTAVLVLVVIFTALVFLVDYIMGALFQLVQGI